MQIKEGHTLAMLMAAVCIDCHHKEGNENMATVAESMAKTLKELGVRYVFGVPSANWVDYMAAIQEVDGLDFILVSNEASGGFMADVCWRLTGTPAACFGTFGPGACNLTTGVCCGFLDRSPMLAFTDEMSDEMLNRTAQMNIDHQALFKPITKWTTRLHPGKVKAILHKALHVATSEVPGPVHIGLPAGGMALREAAVEDVQPQLPYKAPSPDPAILNKMINLFTEARKPILALGITCIRAGVRELVLGIVKKHGIPVVLTPMAKGMIPEDHPCYAGVLAHALSNRVGETHQQADLVVGIGFDPVELNYEDWMPNVPLVHINTVPADLDLKNYTLACDVVGDLKMSLERLASLEPCGNDWDMEELAQRRQEMFETLSAPPGSFGPRAVLAALRESLPADGIMTCDVGAHLHLIGQQWKTPAPELQLMTNGCSSMGFAIPAAIAAKLSCPDRPVCCVVGDGGFLMMVGEMATAMRLGVHVVFVLMTDRNLSLIRIKQESKGYRPYGTQLFGENYSSARSFFGVPVLEAHDADGYRAALANAFASRGPVMVEAFVDTKEYDDLILKGNR